MKLRQLMEQPQHLQKDNHFYLYSAKLNSFNINELIENMMMKNNEN
jgi:hypothetical protein